MSMIERVALAIEKIVNDNWENGDITTREQVTRAAIEAMREPTDAMIDCGVDGDDAVDIYQRMIDAALLEWESGD